MTTTKKYNSIEAISLLLKGNKICYVGHNHDTGYYFDVSYTTGYEEQKFNPRVVEHNGDGSIYEDNVNILDNLLFLTPKRTALSLKKKWIIAKAEDFGLESFPVLGLYYGL